MDQSQAHVLALLPFFFLFGLVAVAIIIFPLWRICTRAGLAGPLALLTLLWPIGLLIVLYILAFADWKVVPVATLPYPPTYPPPPSYPPASYPPQAPPAA